MNKRDKGRLRKLYIPSTSRSLDPSTHSSINQFHPQTKQIYSSCLTPVARISLPVSCLAIFPSSRYGADTSAEAKEEITPDSTKSTQDKIKETVTDTTDRFARGTQPDDQKSIGQQAVDKGERAHDNKAHGGATETM